MRIAKDRQRPVRLRTFALTSVAALAVAGCSGDTTRWSELAYQDPVTTGTLAPTAPVPQGGQVSAAGQWQQPVQQAPAVVYAQPSALPQPVQSAALQAPPPMVQQQPVMQQPVIPQPAAPQATYQPPVISAPPAPALSQTRTAVAAPVVATPRAAPAGQNGRVQVQSGDTLYGIAIANDVRLSELMAANNISDASRIRVGQTLVLPGAAPVRQPAANQVASLQRPAPRSTRNDGPSVAYQAPPPRPAQRATAAPAAAATTPVQRSAPLQPRGYTPPVAQQKPAVQPRPVTQGIASTGNTAVDNVPKKPVQTVSLPTPASTAATEKRAGSFGWPAQGKIVSGFGRKSNGAHNDGINIALPEGTPIRASKDGVVAYSGNELKGFGNLVLIRHEGDWVTAYAHASSLKVKRGDKIKKGDVIGYVGQTGAVDSPQLHFEVRKGSRPVDPMPHLGAG